MPPRRTMGGTPRREVRDHTPRREARDAPHVKLAKHVSKISPNSSPSQGKGDIPQGSKGDIPQGGKGDIQTEATVRPDKPGVVEKQFRPLNGQGPTGKSSDNEQEQEEDERMDVVSYIGCMLQDARALARANKGASTLYASPEEIAKIKVGDGVRICDGLERFWTRVYFVDDDLLMAQVGNQVSAHRTRARRRWVCTRGRER